MENLFNTYLPAIALLYQFAVLVFTLAEFQHNIREIPKIILTKFGKSVTLLGLYAVQMYVLFANPENPILHQILFICIGLLIIIEASITSKAMLQYLRYTEKNFNDLKKFENFSIKLNKRLILCNNLLFRASNIISTIILILLTILIFVDFKVYLVSLFVLTLVLAYYKILILKYIHKVIK